MSKKKYIKKCLEKIKFFAKVSEKGLKIVGKLKKKVQKLCVGSYQPGCQCGPTPGRDPTTARHGDFWLLGFPSGPVRLSLANLVTLDSSGVPILMASLVRTPSQREPRTSRCPRPQTLRHNQPPSSRITGAATLPAESTLANCRYKLLEIDRFNPKLISQISFSWSRKCEFNISRVLN